MSVCMSYSEISGVFVLPVLVKAKEVFVWSGLSTNRNNIYSLLNPLKVAVCR